MPGKDIIRSPSGCHGKIMLENINLLNKNVRKEGIYIPKYRKYQKLMKTYKAAAIAKSKEEERGKKMLKVPYQLQQTETQKVTLNS
ncbi:hypothetical protein TNIN_94611 [Trichonephila inaurata madagascariensis]|uniref:Uncharacterized protein n=1 Tax=Trichonephila inaurata madagascariensis TaxID=2747483 RepID=A0A8X6IYC7_9ARAC|nr:hypothetical protein TNIN_94611 [Trichonephila inaurata madagascariensis]